MENLKKSVENHAAAKKCKTNIFNFWCVFMLVSDFTFENAGENPITFDCCERKDSKNLRFVG